METIMVHCLIYTHSVTKHIVMTVSLLRIFSASTTEHVCVRTFTSTIRHTKSGYVAPDRSTVSLASLACNVVCNYLVNLTI